MNGTLLIGWVVFPALAFTICAGCGLLVRATTGDRLPGPLVPAVGYAAIVVVGQSLTLGEATAKLTTAAVVVLAVAGVALAPRSRPIDLEPWAFAAAAGAFAIFAAPIVLSGEATVAGFIKLDDTATWLAFTDRVIEHGRDLGGLAGSTYEATLALNIGEGYPIGVFVPLGIGSKLLATDPAWLIQPYMASLGALLSLGLWSLATPLTAAPRLRCAAALVGSVPALLYGYYLWGGVKELAAAALIASTAALAVRAVAEPSSWRRLLAPTVSAAALIGVLSAGAGIWLLGSLVPAAVIVGLRTNVAAAARRGAAVLAGLAVLSLPVIVPGGLSPPTSSPLTDDSALGNLLAPLDPLQLAGIWGAGDFRLAPSHALVTDLLIAVACLAAAAGVVWSLRRRELGPPLFVLGALAGCATIAILGSPWVEGKAYATASAAIPFAAMLAVGALAASRRIAAAALAVAVVGGIAWSNALAYRDVSLAPRDQLAELERIGERIAGQGPTLITEYSPYGARHLLRDADPESISELRRRPIALRDGSQVPKTYSADTDRIDPAALNVYTTLVVRRSPAASRPPAQYRLIWRGEYYEAWQRAASAQPPIADLPLGDREHPVAVPACRRVLRFAAGAPAGSELVAATMPAPIVVELGDPPALAPPAGASEAIEATIDVRRRGEYEIWLRGSLMPQATTDLDGREIGSVRGQLNNRGGYVRLAAAALEPGTHRIRVAFGGPDLHPGSGGPVEIDGPLTASRAGAADARLLRVAPGEARRLCGRRLDWIEQVEGDAH